MRNGDLMEPSKRGLVQNLFSTSIMKTPSQIVARSPLTSQRSIPICHFALVYVCPALPSVEATVLIILAHQLLTSVVNHHLIIINCYMVS